MIATLIACILIAPAAAQEKHSAPELMRTVRTWEFLPVVGSRAGLFGDETGRFEAWVYPLKVFRGFHLVFHVGGRALPAESLSRTLTVHPESASILYAGDSFRVRETLFVPINGAAAIVLLDVETEQPLEIEAAFTPDFELEWPAALGGTYVNWDAKEHAFVFGEEAKKFAALVGSPTGGGDAHLAYETNYSSSDENSMRLGVTERGKERKAIVLAASVAGLDDALKNYHQLSAAYGDAEREAANYYHAYLDKTVSLELPDANLQQAYDWARISTIQGLVNNPYLGTGIVAGYRTSGVGQRPGFAWFFGRDSMWTSFALNAEGDYATTRTAIDFISKYQRQDGKVPHEISQSASLVPWFKDYPYAYVSADATPLLIIAIDDYVRQSGDLAFAREKWDNVWRAYQFMRSTYDSQGLAKNFGVGHGWVEGGPLLPVKNEYYQSGLAVEALRAASDLARMIGKDEVSEQLAAEFEHARPVLEQAFWSPEINSYAFAQKQDGERSNEASVLTTVPMWFGLSDESHADQTITRLAEEDHQTDWGMRIISNRSKVYDGSGYHYGSVWPLFTGWASVAEYRYHRTFPAYENLRANALLAFDGALGHFSEVLSGDYNQSFSTSSPHQIWSAAMVISPILRGMFGLETDAQKHQITLAPHVPADWTSLEIRNVHVSGDVVSFQYRKTADSVVLDTKRTGNGECWIDFSPAFSLRTQVVSVELNGHSMPFKMLPNRNDQHLSLRFKLDRPSDTIVIRTRNEFGLALTNLLPPLGSGSLTLRVVSEAWNSSRSQLALSVAGLPGHSYELSVWNPSQVLSVDGGTITKAGKLEIQFPDGPSDSYVSQKVTLHFAR
ncbi:MAG TPA: amylo-alpha-1,6-glucosidase [Candidatus Acidoferrum sp.]|nr:amylo-alpha-1,6-glucosidase [Candidatus Acidoferrum sp.]